MSVAALYIALYVILIVGLSANVSRYRIRHKVSFGDGGVGDLGKAIRAHGNSIENLLPFGLLLLALGAVGTSPTLLHALGGGFLITRLVFLLGYLRGPILLRQISAAVTLVLHLGSAITIIAKVAL